MSRIAVLLNGPTKHDYRVIKTINTLQKVAEVDLFYVNGNKTEDASLFGEKVNLYSVKHPVNLKIKLLRHSFFCREFLHLLKDVKRTGQQYDFVWANDLPTLLPAVKISKSQKAKLIYDSHEIYLETLNQFFPRKASMLKGLIFKTLLAFMKLHGRMSERKLIRKVDHFITVNHSLLEYFTSKYSIKNGTVIYNFPKRLPNKIIPIDFYKRYNWNSDDTILIYQGVLNHGRGLPLLLEAMKELNSRFKLVVAGDGPLKEQLCNYVKRNGLNTRIRFTGMVPIQDLPSYTTGADIGINILEDLNLSKKLASPNKLFEYIQAEIPIVYSRTIENGSIASQYNIGLETANNLDQVVKTIEKLSSILMQDENSFKSTLKIAGRNFEWEHQEEKLLELVTHKY